MAEGGSGTIRVLLADDDRAFLESLTVLIERQPDLSVVDTALDGLAGLLRSPAGIAALLFGPA